MCGAGGAFTNVCPTSFGFSVLAHYLLFPDLFGDFCKLTVPRPKGGPEKGDPEIRAGFRGRGEAPGSRRMIIKTTIITITITIITITITIIRIRTTLHWY